MGSLNQSVDEESLRGDNLWFITWNKCNDFTQS